MSQTIAYFGYGSNLWLDQMHRRCPQNKFIGVGKLTNWKWIINIRGYANIIPSPGDVVYGFIFELTPEDRRALDKYEGVEYERKSILIDLIDVTDLHAGSGKKLNSLVYVDVERLSESHPKKEYIHRMNMAIDDALKEGVPNDYIDRYLRPFIPAPGN